MCRILIATICFLTCSVLGSVNALADEPKPEKKEVAQVTTPKKDQEVERIEVVEGIIDQEKKSGWPVILIRPVTGGQPWYAQELVEDVDADDGTFSVEAYFGDENSKPGTKFAVMIVVVESKEIAENKYKAGTTHIASKLAKLPKSKQITVVRK